jgi:BirA family biotin operon repressor/biotin-[acetyl-CoA-carboxylase] ligase
LTQRVKSAIIIKVIFARREATELTKKRIESLMKNKADVMVFDSVDSTNSEAKRRAEESIKSPVLLVAREQRAGRGRMGRSFLSRRGRGIFMSLLYYTHKPICDAVSITTAAAAIVASEIESASGTSTKIKWVNDIYNDRGKVCGILTETLPLEGGLAVIVGIGINLGEDDFPEELRGIASAIGDIGEREDVLIAKIADGLLEHAREPEKRDYMAEYRKRFMLGGENVDLLQNGEKIGSGMVVGVDDDGGLIYIPHGKTESVTLRSGEVSVRKTE